MYNNYCFMKKSSLLGFWFFMRSSGDEYLHSWVINVITEGKIKGQLLDMKPS